MRVATGVTAQLIDPVTPSTGGVVLSIRWSQAVADRPWSAPCGRAEARPDSLQAKPSIPARPTSFINSFHRLRRLPLKGLRHEVHWRYSSTRGCFFVACRRDRLRHRCPAGQSRSHGHLVRNGAGSPAEPLETGHLRPRRLGGCGPGSTGRAIAPGRITFLLYALGRGSATPAPVASSTTGRPCGSTIRRRSPGAGGEVRRAVVASGSQRCLGKRFRVAVSPFAAVR